MAKKTKKPSAKKKKHKTTPAKKKTKSTSGVEEEKHTGGRPTKYKLEYCDLTKYLIHCKENRELPSICGYAVYLEVAENTVIGWGKKDNEFLRSLGKLLSISKQTLMNKGLDSTYNSTIAKLILSSNHGMKERLDQTSGDKPIDEPLTFEEMKRRFLATEKANTGIDTKSIEGGHGSNRNKTA